MLTYEILGFLTQQYILRGIAYIIIKCILKLSPFENGNFQCYTLIEEKFYADSKNVKIIIATWVCVVDILKLLLLGLKM